MQFLKCRSILRCQHTKSLKSPRFNPRGFCTKSQLLDILTEEQRNIVTSNDPRKIVVGMPGTGKTVIVGARIVDLILNKKVKPSEILALTFNDTNTKKLEQLVELNIPLTQSGVKITQAAYFLNDFLAELSSPMKKQHGIPDQVKITSYNQQMNFIQSHLNEMPSCKKYVEANPRNLKQLSELIFKLRDSGISPEHFYEQSQKESENLELATCYMEYHQIKQKFKQVVDPRDQLEIVSKIWNSHPDMVSNQFRHILMDDLQDSSISHFEAIQHFAKSSETVLGTIDDDQSTRGSALDVFQKIVSEMNPSIVSLRNNYRCSNEIISKCRNLIMHNPNRIEMVYNIPKNSESTRDDKDSFVKLLNFGSSLDEETIISNEISQLENSNTIGILCSTNSDVSRYSHVISKHFPSDYSGIFLEDPEIAEIMNFLNYLVSPNNLRYLYDLCISYNFPPKDLALLFSEENPVEMLNKISKGHVTSQLSEEGVGVCMTMSRDLEHFWSMCLTKSTNEIVIEFLKKMKFSNPLDLLDKYRSNEEQGQKIAKFLKFVHHTEISQKSHKPVFVLPHLESTSENDLTTSRIHISTIHKSKSLEFDYVFLKFSYFPKDRNLFYIAMSRARKGVFILGPSRFAYEAMGVPVPVTDKWFQFKQPEFVHKNEFQINNISESGTLSVEEINFSDVETFVSCPLQFRYNKFLELPKIETKKSVGKIFYPFMNQYFLQRLKGNFDMSEFVTEVTNSDEFSVLDDAEKNTLTNMMKKFPEKYKDYRVAPSTVLNKEFSFDFEGVKIVGTWDRLETAHNGSIVITQSKSALESGRKIPKKLRRDRDNNEMLFYLWAYKQVHNVIPSVIRLKTVDEEGELGTIWEHVMATERELEEFGKMMGNIITSIKQSEFKAKPNFRVISRKLKVLKVKTCGGCSYKQSCPSSYVKNKPLGT